MRAFTLLEMIITISIILVVTSISFYQHEKFSSRSTVLNDAFDLVETIRLVQEYSGSSFVPSDGGNSDEFGEYRLTIPIGSGENYRLTFHNRLEGEMPSFNDVPSFVEEYSIASTFNEVTEVRWGAAIATSGSIILKWRQPEFVPKYISTGNIDNDLSAVSAIRFKISSKNDISFFRTVILMPQSGEVLLERFNTNI